MPYIIALNLYIVSPGRSQNKTEFSINLICFFKLPSAEELEQKEKAYTRRSQCPVSELH